MEDRDILLRQLNSFTRAISKLLSDLLQNNNTTISDHLNLVNRVLNQELQMDLNQLLVLNNDDLINLLVKENNLDNQSLDDFVNILLLINLDSNLPKTKINKFQLLNTSLMLLNFINSNSKTYSIERINRINNIKNKLLNL